MFPFFDRDTRKDTVEFRKLNTCKISTNMLKRIVSFLDATGHPQQFPKDALKSKKYYNRFYVPRTIVGAYILWECDKNNIKPVSQETHA
jgi:hypothetical protein